MTLVVGPLREEPFFCSFPKQYLYACLHLHQSVYQGRPPMNCWIAGQAGFYPDPNSEKKPDPTLEKKIRFLPYLTQ